MKLKEWKVALILLATLMGCSSSDKEKGDQKVEDYIKEAVINYYPNGKLKLEGNTVNGNPHGVWRYYYENGFVWSEGKFKHGVRDGSSTLYYESGKKHMQGNYNEGERIGWWKVWKEDGNFADSLNLDESLNSQDSLLLGLK